MKRLFVGIGLPQAIRDRLSTLQSGLSGARWVAPENLHITLRFIGDVDEGMAEDIGLALEGLEAPSFTLALEGLGAFESRGWVRSIWAGVGRSDPLAFLHAKIASALLRTELPPDGRKFTPHITLARLKKAKGGPALSYLETHDGFAPVPFAVEHFTLFRSHLGRGGVHYENLADYRLTPELVQ